MATHYLSGNAVLSAMGMTRLCLLENEVDLGENIVATGDVVEALPIAAGWHALQVWTEITEKTNLTSTATVGDGAGAASWDASINLNAAVGTVLNGVGGVDAYATALGKYYAAADTIDLTCTITAGPCAAGKVKVKALVIKVT